MAQPVQLTREQVLNNDYEPYDNRNRPTPTNKVETLINLIKAILGTGILALPEAFLNSGYVIGTIFTVILTFLVTYSFHLLFQGMYFICKRNKVPQVTYPEAMKEALLLGPNCLRKYASKAPCTVNLFIIVYQVGVLCVYLVFIATNIKQVVDEHTTKTKHFSIEMYMIFLLLPLLLTCFVKNLKMLAPFSNVANWITLIGLIMIYYFVFEDGVENLSERKTIASLETLPLFIGTTMFSVLSVGSILTIEFNVKYPRYWSAWYGTFNQAMIFVTVLNLFTGFFGYWKYGDETESSITLNVDISNPIAQAIRILFAIAIFFSFALQTFPITEILLEQYLMEQLQASKSLLFWDYILRTIFVLLSFVLAVGIPRLGLFISLFGAFCLSVLGLIFPPILDLCLRWPNDFGPQYIMLWRNLFLIFFGFCGFIFGTYSSVYAIVISFAKDE